MTRRVCRKCGESKPRSEFKRWASTEPRYYETCNACHQASLVLAEVETKLNLSAAPVKPKPPVVYRVAYRSYP